MIDYEKEVESLVVSLKKLHEDIQKEFFLSKYHVPIFLILALCLVLSATYFVVTKLGLPWWSGVIAGTVVHILLKEIIGDLIFIPVNKKYRKEKRFWFRATSGEQQSVVQ